MNRKKLRTTVALVTGDSTGVNPVTTIKINNILKVTRDTKVMEEADLEHTTS